MSDNFAPPATPLVTVKTAAQMLAATPCDVADLCDAGLLPSGRIGDRIVIPHDAVTAYAEAVTA